MGGGSRLLSGDASARLSPIPRKEIHALWHFLKLHFTLNSKVFAHYFYRNKLWLVYLNQNDVTQKLATQPKVNVTLTSF